MLIARVEASATMMTQGQRRPVQPIVRRICDARLASGETGTGGNWDAENGPAA